MSLDQWPMWVLKVFFSDITGAERSELRSSSNWHIIDRLFECSSPDRALLYFTRSIRHPRRKEGFRRFSRGPEPPWCSADVRKLWSNMWKWEWSGVYCWRLSQSQCRPSKLALFSKTGPGPSVFSPCVVIVMWGVCRSSIRMKSSSGSSDCF